MQVVAEIVIHITAQWAGIDGINRDALLLCKLISPDSGHDLERGLDPSIDGLLGIPATNRYRGDDDNAGAGSNGPNQVLCPEDISFDVDIALRGKVFKTDLFRDTEGMHCSIADQDINFATGETEDFFRKRLDLL